MKNSSEAKIHGKLFHPIESICKVAGLQQFLLPIKKLFSCILRLSSVHDKLKSKLFNFILSSEANYSWQGYTLWKCRFAWSFLQLWILLNYLEPVQSCSVMMVLALGDDTQGFHNWLVSLYREQGEEGETSRRSRRRCVCAGLAEGWGGNFPPHPSPHWEGEGGG